MESNVVGKLLLADNAVTETKDNHLFLEDAIYVCAVSQNVEEPGAGNLHAGI